MFFLNCTRLPYTFDASTNLCVDASSNTTSGFTTMFSSLFSNRETFVNNPIQEAMVNSVLIKNSGSYKTDYTMDGNNRVKPYGSNSFINFR